MTYNINSSSGNTTPFLNAISSGSILSVVPGNVNLDDILTTMQGDFPVSITKNQLGDLFSGYILNAANNTLAGNTPFPNWNAFATGWQQWCSTHGPTPNTTWVPKNSPMLNLYNAFLPGYLTSVGSSIGSDGSLSGDLAILNSPGSPALNPPMDFTPPTVSSPNLSNNNPFGQFFSQFLINFPTDTLKAEFAGTGIDSAATKTGFVVTTAGQTILDYILNGTNLIGGAAQNPNPLNKFLTTAATLTPASSSLPASFANLPSFSSIYSAFGPSNGTLATFIAELKDFYNQVMQPSAPGQNTAFIPSQLVSQWITRLRNENNLAPIIVGKGSLDGNESEKIVVLLNILALLIKLINSLQQVGITQAQRLVFITNFQKAYTTLQTQVPTFTSASPGAIGGTGSVASDIRSQLNSSFNSSLIDNMRTLRGLWEDTGKQQQSSINSTNDAVNQQTDMCTTFIQQISSLLSVILR